MDTYNDLLDNRIIQENSELQVTEKTLLIFRKTVPWMTAFGVLLFLGSIAGVIAAIMFMSSVNNNIMVVLFLIPLVGLGLWGAVSLLNAGVALKEFSVKEEIKDLETALKKIKHYAMSYLFYILLTFIVVIILMIITFSINNFQQ